MATLYDLMMAKRGLGTPLIRNTDAYAGGTPTFNEFSGGNTIMPGTPMPQPMPLPQPAGPMAGGGTSSTNPGAPVTSSFAPTMATPTGGMLKPDANYGASYNTGGLAPLQGQDLTDLQHTVLSGQYNGALADRLGSQYNAYVNLYGPGGALWGQTRNAYATAPGGGGNAFAPAGAAPTPPVTGNPITPNGTGSGAAPGMPHGDNFPGLAGGGDVAGGFGNLGGPDAYALDPNKYLNPLMDYALATGTKAINNSAAASGNLMSGNTLRELMAYGTGVGANNWNNAVQTAQQQQGFHAGLDSADRAFGYNAAVGDRQFGYDAANNDRQFGYNAALGDRAFNTQRDEFLAQLGMSGAQGASGLDQTLASAIAQNLATQGGINANGTIGQNNAITGSISQIIQALQSGRTLNDIMGRISPTPTPTPTPTGGP